MEATAQKAAVDSAVAGIKDKKKSVVIAGLKVTQGWRKKKKKLRKYYGVVYGFVENTFLGSYFKD